MTNREGHMTKRTTIDPDKLLSVLHNKVGICGHCGKKQCASKASTSRLPNSIPVMTLLAAIEESTEVHYL